MANVEKMSISLPTDLAATVHAAVESGQYASSSEVIREALRDWQQSQELERAELEYLRAAWKEGIESGTAGRLDMDATMRKVRQRLARERDGG